MDHPIQSPPRGRKQQQEQAHEEEEARPGAATTVATKQATSTKIQEEEEEEWTLQGGSLLLSNYTTPIRSKKYHGKFSSKTAAAVYDYHYHQQSKEEEAENKEPSPTQVTSVPPTMALYGRVDYWNERYSIDKQPFEWYQQYSGIKHLLTKYVLSHNPNAYPSKSKRRVLVVGCGNSQFSQQLLEDGYLCENVISVDYSTVVIEQMKQRYPHAAHQYICMNVTSRGGGSEQQSLSMFENQSFDLILLKGTFDSLLCGAGNLLDIKVTMLECSRLLSKYGAVVIVTHATPENRLAYIEDPIFGWTIDVYKVPKPPVPGAASSSTTSKTGGRMEPPKYHYVYILRKGAASAIKSSPSAEEEQEEDTKLPAKPTSSDEQEQSSTPSHQQQQQQQQPTQQQQQTKSSSPAHPSPVKIHGPDSPSGSQTKDDEEEIPSGGQQEQKQSSSSSEKVDETATRTRQTSSLSPPR